MILIVQPYSTRHLYVRLIVGGLLVLNLSVSPNTWSMGTPPASGPVSAFTRAPELKANANQHEIHFAVSRPSPVTVHIENKEGRVVRHLASGMLGGQAPEPLASETLTQTLAWDGSDDAGNPVTPGPYTAVVGLGIEAAFERSIGEQPGWYGNIHALAADPQGNIYLAVSEGSYLSANSGIIVLDREGRYRRQIAPPPHTLSPQDLPGLDPVRLPDGTPWFRRGLDGYGGHIWLDLEGGNVASMAISPRNELLIPGPPGSERPLLRLGTDGRVPANAFSTRLTKLPDAGFLSVAVCPTGETLYMAGAEAGYIGHDARAVVARHAVYRLRLDSPGPPEIFTGDDENRGGPGFNVNRPKGLATDAHGRVYVCNYGGNTIAVYTPGAGLLRSIAVDHPQQVAVDPHSGRLYVLAGREEGWQRGIRENAPTMKEARLLRFSAEGEMEIEMTLEHPFMRMETTWRPGPSYRLVMTADFSGPRPVVWLGLSAPDARHARWRLLRIEDEGTRFGKQRELCPIPDQGVSPVPLHLLHDADSDMLYVNDNHRLIRYSGDGQTVTPLPLISIDGEEQYFIVEAALGPDRTLYALTWDGSRWDGWRRVRVRRFTLAGTQIPFEGGRLESEVIARAMKGPTGRSSRGMTVDASGRIYALYYDRDRPDNTVTLWERGWAFGTALAVFNPDGTLQNPRLVAHLRAGAMGIRTDTRGNLYLGESIMPLGVTYPRDFAAVLPDPLKRPYPALTDNARFDPLLRWQGSILSFGPHGGTLVGLPEDAPGFQHPQRPNGDLWRPPPHVFWHLHNNHRLRVSGARWLHHGVFSPIPAQYQGVTHVERCVCSGGRFDIDPFNRLVVPDRIRHRITMLDAAGNVMATWGRAGNRDSVSSGSTLFLTDPWWVAASADRIHIGEKNPVRIQRWTVAPIISVRRAIHIPEKGDHP